MIYKLGHPKDLRNLMITELKVVPLMQAILTVLDEEYGADRDIDEDDGGYVIYASRGTKEEELKAAFDFSTKIWEDVEYHGNLVEIIYLLNNEYSVTLVMAVEDLPEDLKQGLEAKPC